MIGHMNQMMPSATDSELFSILNGIRLLMVREVFVRQMKWTMSVENTPDRESMTRIYIKVEVFAY